MMFTPKKFSKIRKKHNVKSCNYFLYLFFPVLFLSQGKNCLAIGKFLSYPIEKTMEAF